MARHKEVTSAVHEFRNSPLVTLYVDDMSAFLLSLSVFCRGSRRDRYGFPDLEPVPRDKANPTKANKMITLELIFYI